MCVEGGGGLGGGDIVWSGEVLKFPALGVFCLYWPRIGKRPVTDCVCRKGCLCVFFNILSDPSIFFLLQDGSRYGLKYYL